MERTRIKYIIIALLLLLNGFFLALNLKQKQQEAAAERSIVENVIQIMEKHQIRLDEAAVPWNSSLKTYVHSREYFDDRSFAARLVGEVSQELPGASIKYYGAEGLVEMSQYGRFVAHYHAPQSIALSSQEEARAFLKQLGIEAMPCPGQTEGEQYSFWQTIDGLPDFSCQITLSLEEGRLHEIRGRRLAAQLEPGAERIHTAATLLIALAEAKAAGQISCEEILHIQEGYLNQGVTPVWRVTTDQGVLDLECVTGGVRHVM